MSEIRVYNTLSKSKELFQPIRPPKVGIYLCGPTVYAESHIGHMVGPVIFDTIKRYLRYSGYDVTWVVNITDVDDKLIAKSRERNLPVSQIAIEMTADYLANLRELGVNQIDYMPRATDHIEHIIRFISDLVEKDFAYSVDGDVFFDVSRDPQYGQLSNRSADAQQGEGGEAAAKKRSPGDFALWKQAKPDEISWKSPWGEGRPGWHIECSAMSHSILGETFDIHGGGLDLMFPHHENELAQSGCCHGSPMATYWMHNGLMEDAEGKLSKSRGERITLEEVFEECPPASLRFYLLSYHYRDFTPYTPSALLEACNEAEKLGINAVDCMIVDPTDPREDEELVSLVSEFEEALADDLDTPRALKVLRDLDKIAGKRLRDNNNLGPVSGMYSIFECVLGLFSN